ncbi:MAG TPA: M3 family metallopeptidase [Polyangia bacterium]
MKSPAAAPGSLPPTVSTSLPPGNPFFRFNDPPAFDQIDVKDVIPAVRTLIARQDAARVELEGKVKPANGEVTWESLVQPLADLAEPLGYAWGIVHHLLSVKNSGPLREAESEVQPEVVASALALGQSRPFYDGYVALRRSPGWASLSPARQRIIESSILDAELAGVALEGEKKQRFLEIATEMAEATTTFANNLLDATKAYALILRTREEAAGLPASTLAAAAQSARENAGDDVSLKGATAEAGPWRITLEGPLYIPFMEHSTRGDLREQLYRAFITRASSGEHDNLPLLRKILRLRREEAALLGFPSYAALGLKRKMAKEVPAARALLDELRSASRSHAEHELAELTEFARAQSGTPGLKLALWDVPFWAERLREQRYSYKEEELRDYFPLPAVLDGLFALAQRLFGVSITPADGAAPVWHPDVRIFRVSDVEGPNQGKPRALFFLDPYSRPADKRGGAWVAGCLDRKRLPSGEIRQPVAYVVCNQAAPVDGKPSLMTFREVETLFHEFGHALQHMLTTVDEPGAAGSNNIEWDAVELPSQFMENWCYHRPTLLSFARHHATGAPLPESLFEKVSAARNFRAGSAFLRQIYFATLDLELHDAFDPEKDDVLALQGRVAASNTVIPPLAEDRFLCGFSHIFAGGYAAGYYSYKWAEVLSADAFAAFEEAGLDDPERLAATGRRFRDTVLALGGSQPPAQVFEAFRGRPATTRALLLQAGLLPKQAA